MKIYSDKQQSKREITEYLHPLDDNFSVDCIRAGFSSCRETLIFDLRSLERKLTTSGQSLTMLPYPAAIDKFSVFFTAFVTDLPTQYNKETIRTMFSLFKKLCKLDIAGISIQEATENNTRTLIFTTALRKNTKSSMQDPTPMQEISHLISFICYVLRYPALLTEVANLNQRYPYSTVTSLIKTLIKVDAGTLFQRIFLALYIYHYIINRIGAFIGGYGLSKYNGPVNAIKSLNIVNSSALFSGSLAKLIKESIPDMDFITAHNDMDSKYIKLLLGV